tara:strand:- start:518 stop:688 length:171 start_codon:yes stop_codon:yes gene_type:complete
MSRLILLFLFVLIGCPKKNDTKTLTEIEREKAIEELMNSGDEEDAIEDLPEADDEE